MEMQKSYRWLVILSGLLIGCLASCLSSTQPQRFNALVLSPPAETLQASLAWAARAGVELSPGLAKIAEPGEIVIFTHILTNAGDGPDTFVARTASSGGWPVALTTSDYLTGTVRLPLHMAASMTTTLRLSLTVPMGTAIISGTRDTVIITVTSQVSPALHAIVTDTLIVSRTYQISLPIIHVEPEIVIRLGVDFGDRLYDPDVLTHDLPLVRQTGAEWIRLYVSWLEIETSPGHYEWDVYDARIAQAAKAGFKHIATVYGAPPWAAVLDCGPISDTVALESFLGALITRYGQLVDAWEFTNEPEGHRPHEYGPVIGCWGPYPAEYAEQLGIFYNKVRRLDPGALVMIGGLAYDNWSVFDRSFFSKTLQSGAGNYFDVANVHYYPINAVDFPTMGHKVNEIKDIMRKNGVDGKRIWVTETSMHTNTPAGLEGQLNYIVRELGRGFASGADSIFWFGVSQEGENPRLHRWFINLDHEPDQGYWTFQHLVSKLQGARCSGRYTNVPANVEAYHFTAPGRSLYIVWSNTTPTKVKIPTTTDAIWIDRDGQNPRILTVQDNQVSFTVDIRPVFLEIFDSNQ